MQEISVPSALLSWVDYYYVACMICNYKVISNSVTIDYHFIAWVCSMREVVQALILIGHFMLINITIHTIGASSPSCPPDGHKCRFDGF